MKDEILHAIYTRRSVRSYQDRKVEDEHIHELLNAAVMAPSAMNKQPWRFTVVEDPDMMDRLAHRTCDLCRERGIEQQVGFSLKPERIFHKAPLLIFISGDSQWEWLRDDTNLAVQNMFLTAHALGLGSCWIGFARELNHDSSIKQELGLRENDEIVAPLVFGYPTKIPEKIPQREPRIQKWISGTD